MSLDQERWAEALAIERWKGADAPAYIAERIASLTAAGDAAGSARFRAIAWRQSKLLSGTRV